MITDHSHTHDDRQVVLTHASMLRQWLDTEQGLAPAGAFPVRQDLIMPEARPLLHKPQGPAFKTAGEHLPIHRDGGAAPCVVGVEVSHRMVALVPVHVDHDPVEGTDTRHGPTVADFSHASG